MNNIDQINLTDRQSLIENYIISFVRRSKKNETIRYDELKTIPELKYLPAYQLWNDLKEISKKSFYEDNILLTAVVSNARIPGPGFFVQAESLGMKFKHTEEGKYIFWRNELEKVYNKIQHLH